MKSSWLFFEWDPSVMVYFFKIPYITGVGFTEQTTIQRRQLTWDLGYGVLWTPKKSKIQRESRGMLGTWKFQPIAITVMAINLGPVKASNPLVLKMVYWLVVEPTHLKNIRKIGGSSPQVVVIISEMFELPPRQLLLGGAINLHNEPRFFGRLPKLLQGQWLYMDLFQTPIGLS